MKNTIVTLACVFIAPMAFAQTHAKRESRATTATEQSITVTGTKITSEAGSAASYQPFRTLVVNKNTPGSYVINGRGHVVNSKGEVIRTPVRPGTRVRVYYVSMGRERTLDHVVVD